MIVDDKKNALKIKLFFILTLIQTYLSSCNLLNFEGSASSIPPNYGGYVRSISKTCSIINQSSSGQNLSFNWSEAQYASGYQVFCGSSLTSLNATSACSGTATSCSLTNLTAGVPLYCVVEAINNNGTLWCEQNAHTIPIGSFANASSATINSTSVELIWTQATGATGYNILMSNSSSSLNQTVASVTSSPYNVTGLSAGTTYYFQIVANNSTTTANLTSPVTLTTSSISLAPLSFSASAVPGSAAVTLNWSPSTYALTYGISYGTASASYTSGLSGLTGTSHTVSSLSNGTPYYFQVQANNLIGTTSAPQVTATPEPLPGSFTLTATPGSSQVFLGWTNSSNANAYSVYYGSSLGSYSNTIATGFTGSTKTVTGLTNSTPYYFEVNAINFTGTTSALASATPQPAPGSFTLSAVSGSAQVALSWGSSNYATSYTLLYGTSSGSYTSSAAGLTVTSTTLTNLTNNTPYYFQVDAINPVGTTVSPQATATPEPLPGSFTLNATSGNAQVTLGWTSASNVNTYNVSYGGTSGSYSSYATSLASSTTSYPVTGLLNGSTYYFEVSAINFTGTTNETVTGSALAAPGAFSIATAVATSSQVVLSWGAASNASTYNLLYGTSSGTYPTVVSSAIPSSILTGTASGLVNGSTYYFEVQAINISGTTSSAGLAAMPITAPGSFGVTAIPGNTIVTLDWAPATYASTYSVYYGSTTAGSYPNLCASALTGTSQVVSSLLNGSTYYFQVDAINLVGTTTNSPAVSATPVAVPGAFIVTAVPSSAQVTLNWSSAAATSYNLSYGTSSSVFTSSANGLSSTVNSTTITGLTNSTPYYFEILAINAVGSTSAPVVSATPQPAPSPFTLTATPGNSSVSLAWTSATYANSYNVNYGTTNGGPYPTTYVTGTTGTTASITGLTNGTPYYFQVQAVDFTGTTSALTSATPEPLPGSFTLTATPGSGSVSLGWTSAAHANSYNVNYGIINGGPYSTNYITGTTGTIASVTGLSNNTPYYFQVQAVNFTGTTNAPQASATPEPLPGTFSVNEISPGDSSAILFWTSASNVVTYNISYGTASATYTSAVNTNSNGTSASIGTLTNGSTYYFQVQAVNFTGTSFAPEVSTTPEAAPGSFSVTATPGSTSVALAWSAAVNASSYYVNYGTVSGTYPTAYATLAAPTSTETVTGLSSGATYYFQVRASNLVGSSNATVTSTTTTASVPGSFLINSTTAQDAGVILGWGASSNASTYNLAWGTSSGSYLTGSQTGIANTTLTGTVSSLTNGSTYYFQVQAVNVAGTTSATATAIPGSGVLSLSKNTGPVGTIFNLTGGDLSTASSITVNGSTGLILKQSSTGMSALVMPGASTGSVIVNTTSNGTLTSSNNFTVISTGVPNSQQGIMEIPDYVDSPYAYIGYSVAISADSNTAAIGGYYDATYGAVWIFTQSSGSWSEQVKISGSTQGLGTWTSFGSNVALSADGSTLAVSAPLRSSSAGGVLIYTQSSGTWTKQTSSPLLGTGTLTSSAQQGTAIALSADGNTLLSGAALNLSSSGGAWVFTRTNGTSWAQYGAQLSASGAVGASKFGYSVALSADAQTAAIGAFYDNTNIGATYIFTQSAGNWVQQGTKLVGSGYVSTPKQGTSVALSADGNTLLSGGNHDNSGPGAGWVFTRSSGTWSQQGLKITSSTTSQGLGYSCALTADGNTAILGSPWNNSGAFVFTRSSGTWSQQATTLTGTGALLTSTSAQGASVAMSLDGSTVISGGYENSSYTGAFWFFN